MTPGAPTDGARSRLPGHRGSTEAGTTLKDSGQPRRASKGAPCVSSLIDEAGAGFAAPVATCGCRGCPAAHLAANADRSVTRDELFASVWADADLGSDSRTVDAHIRRLRKKLSILPDLISTVRGEGYRFNSTPSVRVRVTRPVTLAA